MKLRTFNVVCEANLAKYENNNNTVVDVTNDSEARTTMTIGENDDD